MKLASISSFAISVVLIYTTDAVIANGNFTQVCTGITLSKDKFISGVCPETDQNDIRPLDLNQCIRLTDNGFECIGSYVAFALI